MLGPEDGYSTQVYPTMPGSLNGFNIIQKSKVTSESQNRLLTVSLYKIKLNFTNFTIQWREIHILIPEERNRDIARKNKDKAKTKLIRTNFKSYAPCLASGALIS